MSPTYLTFAVKALSLINMWPEKSTPTTPIKQYYVTVLITLTTTPIIADLLAQFYEDQFSFSSINENFVALSALFGVIYVSLCFLSRKTEIAALVEDLKIFEKYSSEFLIKKTDESVEFYTKLFIIYGIVGNLCYGLLPVLDYKNCQENKTEHMTRFGIPCGLVVRFLLPIKFDYFPMTELVALHECIVCMLGTTIIMIISMLICGVLIHTTTQLKHLKTLILELSEVQDERFLTKKMNFCVKYHTEIIEYATRADLCFNQMMLLHITWTGLIISILGFEITTTSNYIEEIRFLFHLLGWLGMLFLVCYYGQSLIDESLGIANAAYSFGWYKKHVFIQKYVVLMIVRSQRPLTLKACGLKVMSLAAFLEVLYTAYSYFTLLLKMN